MAEAPGDRGTKLHVAAAAVRIASRAGTGRRDDSHHPTWPFLVIDSD